MARIRSLKPEAFESETLAEVSLSAERTFFGLSTIVDDRGRITDKPAQINGQLWSMRGGHDRETIEAEFGELEKVDLICRYAGCDGKRYLHLVTWDQHQKIDRPSKSRNPRCSVHQAEDDYCGRHDGDCPVREEVPDLPAPSRQSREDSRGLKQGESALAAVAAGGAAVAASPAAPIPAPPAGQAPDLGIDQSSRDCREPSMLDLGPRTVDRGSIQQPTVAAANESRPADPLTITQRSRLLTDAYSAAEPLCKWPAVNGVVIKAIKSKRFTDDEIGSALLRMAAENRSVTVDALRTELGGMPPANGRAVNGHAPKKVNYTDEEYASGW